MNVYSKEKDLQDSLKQVTLEFTMAKEKLSDTIGVELHLKCRYSHLSPI